MLCFRENIFLISEECSKNGGRRGGTEKPKRETEKESIKRRKRIQGPEQERKICMGLGRRSAFLSSKRIRFYLRDGVRDGDNHDYESKRCGRPVLRAKGARGVRRTL